MNQWITKFVSLRKAVTRIYESLKLFLWPKTMLAMVKSYVFWGFMVFECLNTCIFRTKEDKFFTVSNFLGLTQNRKNSLALFLLLLLLKETGEWFNRILYLLSFTLFTNSYFIYAISSCRRTRSQLSWKIALR